MAYEPPPQNVRWYHREGRFQSLFFSLFFINGGFETLSRLLFRIPIGWCIILGIVSYLKLEWFLLVISFYLLFYYFFFLFTFVLLSLEKCSFFFLTLSDLFYTVSRMFILILFVCKHSNKKRRFVSIKDEIAFCKGVEFHGIRIAFDWFMSERIKTMHRKVQEVLLLKKKNLLNLWVNSANIEMQTYLVSLCWKDEWQNGMLLIGVLFSSRSEYFFFFLQ